MKTGTKSVLFGVHQFILHPIFVAMAWWIIYREIPKLHEWAAIITHDIGYFGSTNMDDEEGEEHPERVARWWRKYFGSFGERVAIEVLGHSRFHAAKNGLPLSRLFRPDKLCAALYPKWLYLLLGNLSGEIDEYMKLATEEGGKYKNENKSVKTQMQWLIEVQSHMALMGLHGEKHEMVKTQMAAAEFKRMEILHKCPICGSGEVEDCTPRTVYGCGSSDFEGHIGSFEQSNICMSLEKNNAGK